jgi:hypothetical protein
VEVLEIFFFESRGFLNSPIYFGFNSVEQESMFLRNFEFEGPFWMSNGPNIFATSFFQVNEDR